MMDISVSETATAGDAMQDIAKRVEANLYPEEPLGIDDDEGSRDDESLPQDTDSDSEHDEGSTEELDDIASDEELSLADYLGIDEDRLVVGEDGNLFFNAIIDGETKQVPLKELAASYQMIGHVNNKSIALENERKQFQQVQTQVAQELQQRVQGVAQLSQLAEAELINEYQSIDWNALRYQDPANWTALRQEYAERAQKIQQVQELTQAEARRIHEENAQKFEQMANEYYEKQFAAMLKDNPKWADDNVRLKEVGEMKAFLQTYGFNEHDAMGVNDHRLVRLIRDAKAYRSGLKALDEKREDTKKLPKFQKTGSSKLQAASLAKARAVKAQKSAFKKSGSIKDLAAALESRM